ncbi:hypothetical protein K501DRAFT_331449, partial [Backusella circina FSU 941]
MILEYTSQCPLLYEFDTIVESLVLLLWEMENISMNTCIISSQMEEYNGSFKGIIDVDTVFRELCLMISIAPLRFITQLTLCLLLLTSAVNITDNQLHTSQSAWLRGYTTLLDQAQFEDPRVTPFSESLLIQALFKQAACFIMYQTFTGKSDTINLNPIWEHYDLQRS